MILYNLVVHVYYYLIRLYSFWNPKARAWINGRNHIKSDLENYLYKNEKSVWFHCASLGEFEQGRPLIELIKINHPNIRIVLTFFSPSGYQIQKNYPIADLVTYLPREYTTEIDHFIDATSPMLFVSVKYEYWLNLFKRLDEHKVPRVLISSKFVTNKYPLNFLGKYTIPLLKGMKYIFVQDKQSRKILQKNEFNNIVIAGDTRVDRVLQIANQAISLPKVLISFVQDKKVLICGSTWQDDEILIAEITKNISADWCVIIAPHEIDSPHLLRIKSLFKQAQFLSQLDTIDPKTNVLIIDSIGLLSSIYKLGTIAYIGGAFKTGLHNILEPAAFGLPIIFGPKYKQFNEAVDLIDVGGAFSISNIDQFRTIFATLCLEENRIASKNKITSYMNNQKGSTKIIYKKLEMLLNQI